MAGNPSKYQALELVNSLKKTIGKKYKSIDCPDKLFRTLV